MLKTGKNPNKALEQTGTNCAVYRKCPGVNAIPSACCSAQTLAV